MLKNKKIIFIIIVIISIIISFICGQVYAKYMSKLNGEVTADIASWSFKVNDNKEKIQTISLKSTVNNGTVVDNKIAPGTKGAFQIKLDATGAEVGVKYSIKFENEKNKPRNLKFEYENKIYNSILELQDVLIGTINSNNEDKTKNIIINWNWPYETGRTLEQIKLNDNIDTEDSKTINDFTFDVIITGMQEVPEE